MTDTTATILFNTERLVVQQFKPDDLDVFAALCADSQVMRFVGDGTTLPRSEVERWIKVCQERYQRRGYGTSAVFEKSTGDFVGYCGVVRPSGNTFDELTYVYRAPSWGKGYATEAGRAMLAYVFEKSALAKIYATIHPDNEPSIRVADKLGMRFAKEKRDIDGTYIRHYVVERNFYVITTNVS